jgi:hypothetical protein
MPRARITTESPPTGTSTVPVRRAEGRVASPRNTRSNSRNQPIGPLPFMLGPS